VAVGSSIGHAIGGFFGGGSSAAAPAEAQQPSAAVATNAYGDAQAGGSEWGQRNCEVDAKQFTKCLDENSGNMQICGWYLDQLVSLSSYGVRFGGCVGEGCVGRRLWGRCLLTRGGILESLPGGC
jgi:hypothetical protein